jgi:hypothetical protein
VTTGGRTSIRAFLDAYRAAFEAFDVAVIANLFSYPCQVTSGGPDVAVTTIPSRDVWVPQLEQLVGAYRSIGVRSARVLNFEAVELAPTLAQATVKWELLDEERKPIYDFDACYTVADVGDGLRITAIAHNERPRLQAAIQRHRLTAR